MVTVLRFQAISDKFTAYRICNHSVTYPNNAGRKQQQQQQQQKKTNNNNKVYYYKKF